MTTDLQGVSMGGVLARREMGGYARSPLFWAGVAVAWAALLPGFWSDGDGSSSTMTMIAAAATIGLLGVVVMAGMTKRSDRAAAAAGAVSVGERERTLALASAVAVPLAAALVWFAGAVVQYAVHRPEPWAVPFGPVGDAHVLAVMFALSVVPAAGGPLLGLLVARWVSLRGAAVIAVVVVVLVSILMQGNFEATWRWHVVWPWTYWYGPLGWSSAGTGEAHWMALPGSPFAWIGYLAALCVLGLLVALYHDPEADRARLTRWIAAVAAGAVALLALTLLLGLDAAVSNPLPGPSF